MENFYLKRYQQLFKKYYLEMIGQTSTKRFYINSVVEKERENGNKFYGVSFTVKTFDPNGTEIESKEDTADLKDILLMFQMSNVEMKRRKEQ